MIDSDLASLYGVETKVLKQSVNRNIDRFPEDFMFEITNKEKKFLLESSPRLSNLKFSSVNPYVFTEHGVVMLASILNTPLAVQMSVHVTRVFVDLRETLLSHKDLAQKLNEMESKYDEQFQVVFEAIKELMDPEKQERKPIGYK